MLRVRVAGVLMFLVLSASSPARAGDGGTLESLNRASWNFNHWLLIHVFDPMARGYDWAVPRWGQTGVKNLFENLDRPRDAVNSALQTKWARAGRHLGSFLLDSTLGILGLIRVSEHVFLAEPPETLNETLGVAGLPPGRFLVLPVLGETCPRCLIGNLGDAVLNPLWWIPGSAGVSVSSASGLVHGINSLARQMPDPPASEAAWQAYERRILVWPTFIESRRLFFENLELDVQD